MAVWPADDSDDWGDPLKQYIDEGDANTANGSVPITRTVNGKPLNANVVLAPADVGAQPSDSDLTAIAALSTTAFGRNLLTLADAAAVRSAIGAGTSNLAIGTTSTTAKAGDYNPDLGTHLGTTDLNTVFTPGIYRQTIATDATLARNYPAAPNGGAWIVEVLRSGATTGGIMQRASRTWAADAGRGHWIRSIGDQTGAWTAWRYITTQTVTTVSGQPQVTTWDDVGGVERQFAPVNTTLGTVDLNTITVPGSYHQPSAASATLARNYPVANAGYILEVEVSAGNFVVQKIFATTGTNTGRGFWIRRYVLSGSSWTAWAFVPTHRTAQPLGQPGVEMYAWDESNGVERLLALADISIPSATDLNTITTPGVYRQADAAQATLAKNYPKATVAGTLEVISHLPTASARVIQRYTQYGVSAASPVIWQRRLFADTWSPWVAFASQRVAQSADVGRAIYTWDDLNGREQLLRGDTGWRDIASFLTNGWVTSTGIFQIRRENYDVKLRFSGLNGGTAGAMTTAIDAAFRPPAGTTHLVRTDTGTSMLPFSVNSNGIIQTTTGTFNPQVQIVTWSTDAAWPTALPGTPVGTIPNL